LSLNSDVFAQQYTCRFHSSEIHSDAPLYVSFDTVCDVITGRTQLKPWSGRGLCTVCDWSQQTAQLNDLQENVVGILTWALSRVANTPLTILCL